MLLKLMAMAITLAAACTLGVMRGTQVMRRNPSVSLSLIHRHLPETWPLLGACLASTGASIYVFTHYAALWLVPGWLDPWSLPLLFACSVGPFAFLLAIATRVTWPSRGPARRRLLLAGAVLLPALSSVYVLYSHPIYRDLGDVRTPNGAVLQTSPFSCVPASAANALLQLGLPASEQELARLSGTTVLGTSPGELLSGLRKKGVSARKMMLSVDDLRHLRQPAVLLVDYSGLGPLSHAILFERMEGDFAQLIDPLSGRLKLSLSSLTEQWHGHAICVSREQGRSCVLSPALTSPAP